METIDHLSLSDIVIRYPFTANIFEKYRLDFCCGGKKTLSAACAENELALKSVREDLRKAFEANVNRNGKIGFDEMDLGLLMDYIESNHHAYVRHSIPVIASHLEKVVNAHGKNHPEMKQIADYFSEVGEEMTLHMHKEEKMLFPYIREMIRSGPEPVVPPAFKTVRNPISVMEFEHERAGKMMEKIRTLSGGYQPPQDACTTFRLCLAELDEFERDLHKHVHLENNILFPKSVKIEEELIYNN